MLPSRLHLEGQRAFRTYLGWNNTLYHTPGRQSKFNDGRFSLHRALYAVARLEQAGNISRGECKLSLA